MKLTDRLANLQAQAAQLLAERTALHTAAGDAALSAEAQAAYDALKVKRDGVLADVERVRRDIEDERTAPAASSVSASGGGPVRVRSGDRELPADRPFATLGEQLVAICAEGNPTLAPDLRQEAANKLHAAATGAGAGVGTDGGFMIQKDFAPDLLKDGFNSGVLASQCSVHEVGPNSDGLEVPYINETSRATGSRWGGVQIYRRAEADTVTAKKPSFGLWEVRLEDIMGLAYLTDRLAQDAPAIQGVFTESFVDEFGFKLDDEIFRGSGVGECYGILNAPATVSQAKVTGQSAATIVADNAISMWSRVLPRSKSRGSWFINCECSPQLQKMYVATGVAGELIYMPPNGLRDSANATLFGRPVIEIEHAAALGTVGDISFLDLSQYKLVRKGGIQADESIHVRFIYGERTLRWMTRVNGAPKLKSPITPYKGSNTLGSFVTLATRS